MLEPIIIGDLDIWSDVVEKVHNPEIVRRNHEVTSILTGQHTAQRDSTAAPTPPGKYSAPRRNLLLYSGGWPISDSLGCEYRILGCEIPRN
jgi:hypothetical protein